IKNRMIKLEQDTAHHSRLTVLLACNYGGRDEIAHATREIAELVKSGKLNPEDITENTIAEHLYTAGLPDVDLVIRPSGELRLSNYLIWQCAYAEYYFTDVLWPDFSPEELNKALIDYASRGRRFGGV
ncbi:MAG: di-trans,poly-cis-decaprenylcistransferase, partial [Oscillospiraceae bacterium]|nr:di-trans,poly-cis-decaprenylcistransferase [Oscillospiraceae bacterium]